jgi:hypothetical protein
VIRVGGTDERVKGSAFGVLGAPCRTGRCGVKEKQLNCQFCQARSGALPSVHSPSFEESSRSPGDHQFMPCVLTVALSLILRKLLLRTRLRKPSGGYLMSAEAVS